MELYKDISLSPEARAEDLLSRLSVQQKIAQLMCKMFVGEPEQMLADYPYGVGETIVSGQTKTPEEVARRNKAAIDAIMEKTGGIPPIIHVEAVTGMVSTGATSFPTALGLAATFEPQIVEDMSKIIRKQMLATGVRRALSPVMDVARDPRWGRMGETYGEDPTLAAAMSVAFVRGLQGECLKDGVAATGKHFLGYAMGEGGLNSGSSNISACDLRESYAKPFQAAITEADLQTIMNSYGAVDNEQVVGSRRILTDLLRKEMAFDGVTVSDYNAIDFLNRRCIVENDTEAAARALNAGMNVECPNAHIYSHLKEALDHGQIDMQTIDDAVRRILTLKFKLGLFENPYPRVDLIEQAYQDADCAAHSLRAAYKSIVLLKNDGILPLKKSLKKIAVIGPRADSVRLQYGGYTFPAGLEMAMGGLLKDVGISEGGEGDEYFPGSSVKRESPQVTQMINAAVGWMTPTILKAVKDKCPETEICYEKGCDIAGNDKSGFAAAVSLAKESDVVLLAIGGKYGWGEPCTSGEGRDSTDIGLPGVQEELLRALCETQTPVVVLHGDSRPLSSRYAKEHANAILETWCPGQTGGKAVVDVVFGDYNPAGRLSATALEHAGQVPIFASQKKGNLLSLEQDKPGFNSFANGIQKPLWYFGEGLSYTEFLYSDFEVDAETTADGEVHAAVTVTNTGERDGEEVVQLYFTDDYASMLRPIQELAGFSRVELKAGESKRVCFTMKTSQTAFCSAQMQWVVEKGNITLRVGASSVDIRAEGKCNIKDSAVIDGASRGFVAAAVCEGIKERMD